MGCRCTYIIKKMSVFDFDSDGADGGVVKGRYRGS